MASRNSFRAGYGRRVSLRLCKRVLKTLTRASRLIRISISGYLLVALSPFAVHTACILVVFVWISPSPSAIPTGAHSFQRNAAGLMAATSGGPRMTRLQPHIGQAPLRLHQNAIDHFWCHPKRARNGPHRVRPVRTRSSGGRL